MSIPTWHQYQLVHMYCINEVTIYDSMPVPIYYYTYVPSVVALVDDAVYSIQISIVLTSEIT